MNEVPESFSSCRSYVSYLNTMIIWNSIPDWKHLRDIPILLLQLIKKRIAEESTKQRKSFKNAFNFHFKPFLAATPQKTSTRNHLSTSHYAAFHWTVLGSTLC